MTDETPEAVGLIARLRTFLTDEETIRCYRVRDQDFTRRRQLSFANVVGLVLQGGKQPLQCRVNEFIQTLKPAGGPVTASAFYQARQKIAGSFFQALTNEVSEYFYHTYPTTDLFKTWQGHRVLGTDASYVNLPETDETRQEYSIQSNQQGTTCVQALLSCLYDVTNDLPLNVSLGPIQAEKNFIFAAHHRFWQPNDVVLYDRLYTDYSVIAFHILCGIGFVIRCPLTSTFSAVSEFVQSDRLDTYVTLQVTSRQKEFVEAQGLPTSLTVRLVKLELPDGTTEVLLTSLLDRARYPRPALGWLYTLRWGVETYFNRLKNLLDVERFSCCKLWAIRQDLYALIFLTSLESVLCKAVNATLAHHSHHKRLKYVYRVNKSVSYAALGLFLVDLLQSPAQPIPQVLTRLYQFLRQKPLPHRPGRRVPRCFPSPRRQVRYLRYEKRTFA